ncbi:MAG: creatininase family protein [Bryobacterales bacterium]|nr:creatininase family protein [Bryobacterales bacterium]
MFLADLTWPAVQALNRNLPVAIPIAAVEQHGHHLPVYTDSLLLGEVVRRAEPAVRDRALFAPLQWLGNSHHHIDYPGTMSASPRLYLDLLHDLAENLLRIGFHRILFLNGHGGNIIPCKQVVFELRQNYRARADLLLLFASYWDLAKPFEEREGFTQHAMGHACEWETSMIQRLAPHLVAGDVSQLQTVPFGDGFAPGYRGWITKDRTPTGHIGSPEHANPEKGEFLFNSFSAGVVKFLAQMETWDGRCWS